MFCENCGNKLEENSKFCGKCGKSLVAETTRNTELNTEEKKKYKKRALMWLLSPVFSFLGVVSLWGISNLSSQTDDISDVVMFFNTVLVPFLFGLIFLLSPLAIVFAIYYYLKSKR